MQHFNSWAFIVLAIISFTFLPTQAAIIYDYSPPAKKKKSKKASQKAPSIFSFLVPKYASQAAPNQVQQEQGTYAIEFTIIAFTFFSLAVIASVLVLIYMVIPILIASILIAINALGVVLAAYGFEPNPSAGMSIVYTPIAVLANLILVGLAFSIPWLWISAVVIAGILAVFFLVVLILYLIAMSNPPYRTIIEKEDE
jgi:hypothetical protein